MDRGKPKRRVRRRRQSAVRPRVVVAAFLFTLVGLAAVGLCTTPVGQVLLVRLGVVHPFLERLAVELDVALAEEAVHLGLLRSELQVRHLPEPPVDVRQIRFRSPPHLTPTLCNLGLTRAARRAHARVLQAQEDPRHDGGLLLSFGFPPHVTHRISVLPPEPAETPRPARLALVIDDLGANMNDTTQGILDLGIPMTCAVLPDLSHSDDAFRAAAQKQFPALLHMPMEPKGDERAGRRPLTVGMGEDEIDALIARYQEEYPAFVGINNHMGSRATADAATMRAFARVLDRRGLFFLDSVTTARSVAYKAARAQGVWSLRNDLFLDAETESAETVAERLQELASLARKHGLAVGIAHPRPSTLQALLVMIPRLRAEGIQFIDLEELRQKASAS